MRWPAAERPFSSRIRRGCSTWGGIYGFLILAALAFAFPRLGGAWTIALLVLGQGLAALAVDHYGLLGQPREPITVVRAAGVGLLVAGTLLMRWR